MSPDTTPAAYAAILTAITAHSGAHPDDLDIREHIRVATWILDEMSSTFSMLAFANACDTCDEAGTPHPHKPRPGGNYSDHPEPSDDTAEAARAAAVRLYAAVLDAAEGYDPAPAIVWWVEDPAGDTVARYWRNKAATVLEATARCWGHYAVMSAIGHGVSWDDDNAPLKMAQYAVQWDNGSSACGVFPERFDTEAYADAFGQAWVDECNVRDFGTDDPDEDYYTAEAFDVEARELPRPSYRMGVSAEDIDWCDEATDAARAVLDAREGRS